LELRISVDKWVIQEAPIGAQPIVRAINIHSSLRTLIHVQQLPLIYLTVLKMQQFHREILKMLVWIALEQDKNLKAIQSILENYVEVIQ
jgi:hypothetical protein